ncbi:hypothetical protein SMICM304S_04119 [Streptomyces microflavus]
MTSSRSKTTAEPVRGSRELVSSRSTTSVRRSTWVRAMFALLLHRLRVVGHRDLLDPHGERGERRTQLVRGVRGEAPLGGQHPGDPLGGRVQDVGDPVQLGHPVPLVARAGVAGAEAFGGLGEVGEGGGEPVGLAYGEEHRRDDREQRHRADDQERAPDLAGDGRAGLLDGDLLALLTGLGGAQDAAGGAFPDGDGGPAGDLDQREPVGVDLLGQHPGVDHLVAQQPAVDHADQPQRLGLDALLGAGADGARLHDDQGDTEDGDHHEDHGERGVDQAAAHVRRFFRCPASSSRVSSSRCMGASYVSSSRTGSRRPGPWRCSADWPRRRRASCGARRCACPASWWRTTRWCPRPRASTGRG